MFVFKRNENMKYLLLIHLKISLFFTLYISTIIYMHDFYYKSSISREHVLLSCVYSDTETLMWVCGRRDEMADTFGMI